MPPNVDGTHGYRGNSVLRTIEVQQLKYDLIPVAGLAVVGHQLKTLAPVLARVDAALQVRGGVSNSDILRSDLGLLVQGKSDFDAVKNHRGDKVYKHALGIPLLPSSPTLRQRMDAQAGALSLQVLPMIETLLRRRAPEYGVLRCGWLPVDIDTFAMDNGVTSKEGVGRTDAGVDGYCPLASYIGAHGFCLECKLRPGTQHSAKDTQDKLQRVIPLAQRLSAAGPRAALLASLDAGFDAAALMSSMESMHAPSLPKVTGSSSGIHAAPTALRWQRRSTPGCKKTSAAPCAGHQEVALAGSELASQVRGLRPAGAFVNTAPGPKVVAADEGIAKSRSTFRLSVDGRTPASTALRAIGGPRP